MGTRVQPQRCICFKPFELDLTTRELFQNGRRIRLTGHPLDILFLLLEEPGAVVSRDELRKKLWPEDTFVDFEHGLNVSMSRLRKALQDQAEEPRFIETLPRIGYRLIAPVEAPAPDSSSRREEGPRKAAAVKELLMRHWISAATAAGAIAVVAVLFALNAGGVRDRMLGRAVPPHIESIAVLPLENLSGDPEQRYFAEGMTEELITDLGRISALRVISRTSVMQYEGTRKTLPEIARELHVDAIVEGAVQRSGDRVRITAQLIDARADRHLWAASYERDLRDVLSLQDEVAAAIANQIRIKLTPPEQQRRAARPVNPEAYRLYLEGRYFFNKRTLPAFTRSTQLFQQALEKDPDSARAYAGLSESYAILPFYAGATPRAVFPKARAAALKALEIDSNLAEAHAALGLVLLYYDWDWSGAERELKRAIELNPNYVVAHHWYAEYLTAMGRHEQAFAEIKRAQELDPVSPLMRGIGGLVYTRAGRFDEAIEQCRQALELDPNFGLAHDQLGWAYFGKGMYEKALAEFQTADRLIGFHHARTFAVMVKRGEAVKMLDRASEQSSGRGENSAVFLALLYSSLGERQKALDWLQRAYEQRDPDIVFIRVFPAFAPLHSDRRFQDLIRRMNFPP